MFEAKMKFRNLILLLAGALLLIGTTSTYAQEPAPPPPTIDSIEQLRLTPEQRQRIRMIFEESKNERQVTNRRVREANLSLNQALEAEPTDQNLVEQRINELAAAQAAQLRMRIQTELRIRRELSAEQLATLKRLRLQARDFAEAGRQRPLNQRPAKQGFRSNPNRRDE
jgi:Spy/CpxP family protein refolding chaperone